MKNIMPRALLAIIFAFCGIFTVSQAVTTYTSISTFTSSSGEYNTLYQDNTTGIVYSPDFQADYIRFKPKAITTNTTLVKSDGSQIRIGAIASNTTVTLPSAVVVGDGGVIWLDDIGGVLDATHALTINATAGNINGSATKAYSTAYGGLKFISNGSNWFCR